jgi:hypothetical protein
MTPENAKDVIVSLSPTYRSWKGMLQRCSNPNHVAWKNYGGRGIRVCEQWINSFEAFLSDMGERPAGKTLDRKDNDGNYEPSNCKWSTKGEQALNRRPMTHEHRANLILSMRSPDTRAKMSVAHIGKKFTDEHRANLSAARVGRKRGPYAARANMASAPIGKKLTDEHRAKISAALVGNKRNLGRKHTAKARANMSAAQVGNKNALGRKATDKERATL